MRKRRIYLALLLLAVAGLVSLIVAGALREREPTYEGKKLSEWLREYRFPPFTIIQEGSGHSEIEDAIHDIGTNAVPYLLKWIRYERPAWRLKLYVLATPALRKPGYPVAEIAQTLSHPPHGWLLGTKQGDLAVGAVMAFRTLGPEASAAIPALSEIMNDPKRGMSAISAAYALSFVGDEALSALVAGITNQQPVVRMVCSKRVGAIGTNFQPVLLKLLEHNLIEVRKAATNALLAFDPKALERATP